MSGGVGHTSACHGSGAATCADVTAATCADVTDPTPHTPLGRPAKIAHVTHLHRRELGEAVGDRARDVGGGPDA